MGSTLSVRDVCEHYGVSEHTVLGWLRSGELRGFSVSRRPGGKKPRWRTTQEALEAFELSRTPTPVPPRTRRKKRPADVIEFYK
jgi:transposase